MTAKFIYFVFPFLLISCTTQKTDLENYQVYIWRAIYNTNEISSNGSVAKTETDTLVNDSPIHLDSTDTRSLLYRNLVSDDDSKWHKQLVTIEDDSLMFYENMLEMIWYDEKHGILKIIFPHSRYPGKIKSYELVKQIKVTNGTKNERRFGSIVSAINESREKEYEKLIKGLEQNN